MTEKYANACASLGVNHLAKTYAPWNRCAPAIST